MATTKNRILIKRIISSGAIMAAIFAVFFINVPPAQAATCTSIASGNWATSATWSCAKKPAAGDDVTITSGFTVSLTANQAANLLTVNSGGILDLSTFTLVPDHSVAINGTVNGSGTLDVKAATAQSLSGSGTINSILLLETNNISILSGTNLTVNNTININAKTVTNNGTITVTGNVNKTTGAAAWTQAAGSVLNIGGTFTNAITVTATASPNTVNYNDTAQTIFATAYNNLTLSGSGVKTFPTGTTTVSGKLSMQGTATTTVTGTLTPGAASSLEYKGSSAQTTGGEFITPWPGSGGVAIENASGVTLNAVKSVGANPFTIGAVVSNSIFNDGGFQLTGTGTLNLTSGTFKLGSAGTATTFPAFATRNISIGTTVEYASGVAQTVSATPSYSNLTFSGAGAKTTASGTVTVGSNWSVTGGTATLNTNNTNVTVTGNITGSGPITSGTGNISLAGNWTNNGTFTAGSGTVNYTNASGSQTVAGLTYNNLTLSNTGGTNTASGNITVNGALTTTAGGTLDMTSSYILGGTLATITNNGTIKTSVLTTTSSTPIASGKTWGGTINYASSSGAQTLVAGTFNNLTQSGSSGATLSGNVVIGGTLTLSGGNLTTNANNIYINSTGSVSRTSGFIIGNFRKYIITGATSKTFEIGDSTTNNYAPVTVTFGNVTVAGDLTATTISGDHPNISTSDIDDTKSVNRYWAFSSSGLTFNNYSATFNFNNPGDLDVGANTANFIVAQYNGSTWSDPTVGTLTSTSSQITGVPSGSGNIFQIGEPKPLDHFAFSAIGTQTAGTPFNVTITAQNVNNNTVKGYTGTVDLSTTAGTISPTQSSAFVAGVRIESVTVTQSGTGKTITATDHGGTKTGTSATFTVNPGALDHFSFATISTQTAGTAFNVTMTAQDVNNNTITSYVGTVDLSTTAGTISPTQSSAFSSGVRTESVTVSLGGNGKTITATDHGGTKTGTSATFTVNNPVPTTTSISPTSKTAGDVGFTITVNGTNFVSTSVVNFAGSTRTTTFVNSTQLTASILTADLTAAGTFNITVTNPAPGGGTSNAQTFTVNNPVPTTTSISPTSKIVGDSGFTLTVNGTNFVSTSVANFSGSARTTTFVNATQVTVAILTSDLTTSGTYNITVTNPAPGGGTSNAQTFTVNNPSPTTTSISPTSKNFGDSGFTLTVNGTNFSLSSVVNFAGSARTTTFVSDTQLTAAILTSDLTAAGTFNITVTNPAPGGGTSNAQTFTVNKANQSTLTLTGQTVTYPTAFAALSTTGGSGTGSVSYSVTTAGTAGCSVVGTTLSYTTAGTCGITATKAADSNYNSASSAEATFTINKATQTTLTVTGLPASATYQQAGITAGTSGGSGTGSITFSAGSSTACSINSLTGAVTITSGTGTCTITATKAADTNYNSSTSAGVSITISQANQSTLNLTGQTVTYPTAFAALSTTGGSGTGSVSYSVTTAGTAGCSIVGTTLSYTTAGTCGVTATKAADTNYNSASSAEATFTINKTSQSALTVTSTTGIYPTSVTLTTSGGSGTGAVSYIASDGTATGCSVTGSTLSFTSAGTCIVTATKAADADYNSVSSSATTVTISKGTQTTLTLTGQTVTYPTAFAALSTTGGSGTGSVSYSVTTAGTAGCSIVGTTLSYTTAGTCGVTATKAADSGYNSISSTEATFTVNNPVPTTTSIAPTSKTAGDVGFTLTVNGTNFVSSSVVSFNGFAESTTFVSSTQLTASILASDIVTSGTYNVVVFNPAPGGGTSNAQTFTVGNPVPTTTSISPTSKVVGDSGFTLTVNGTNFIASSIVNFAGSARTTTFVSPTQLTASVLTSDLTAAGTFSITVTNGAPGGGTSNAQTFTVNNPLPTTTSISPTSKTVGDTGFTLTVNGTNFIATSVVNFDGSARITTFVSDTQLTASILTSDLTAAGTFNITVINPAPGGGTSNAQTFTVGNPVPTTTNISPTSKSAGASGFTLTVNGTNFIASSVVNFAGSAHTTTFVSSTQLTANILTSDLTTPGTFNITVTNPAPGGGTSNAQTFTVTQPSATKFVIINPTDGTVDNPITVTVQAERADNTIDTSYQQDVTLVTSGSATGGGLVNIVNGVGTINISDTVAETVNLSLSDSQTTGLDVSSTQDVIFAAGAVTHFILSDPGDTSAGTRLGYTVTRKDQFGNLTISGSTTVYLYSSSTSASHKFYDAATSGNIITSINITDGNSTADFWYYDETPDTYTITVSDNASSPDGATGIVDATDSVVITVGAVSKFTLNDVSTAAVGGRAAYTVTRKDQFDDLFTSGITTVYLYSSTTSSNKKFYDAATGGNVITSIDIQDGNSTANFWYFDDNAGTYSITVSDNSSAPDGNTGIDDAIDSVTFQIVATRFVIINPTDGTVDNPITVTVQAEDASGNLDATYQNDVTLNTSGSATGGGLVNIVNGVGTINISDTVAETVNLSLSDSQSTGLDISSAQDVVFAAGNTAQFSINDPGDTSAGARLGYIITRKDQFGNLTTFGSTTVYLYSSSTSASNKFYDAASSGSIVTSINITDGNSTADFWYYDETPDAYTITVSDNATSPDGNSGINDAVDNITVSAGPTARFILDDPGDMTASTRLGYVVIRKDQFNNLVTSGDDTVYLYSSSTGPIAFYDAATNGNQITSITITGGNSSANFWYYDEAPGSWIVTASDNATAPDGATGIVDGTDSVAVSAAPIVATRFVIIDPTDGTVDHSIAVTVKAEDESGNIDTTYQIGVNLNTSGSATGGGLVNIVNGIGTINISDTVAETINLSLSDSQSTGLGVSSIQSVVFAVGSPVILTLNDPGDMSAGTRIGYTITRKDQFSNLVTSGTTVVYLYKNSSQGKFYDASSGGSIITSVIITDGNSSADFWYYDQSIGTFTITASDNATSPDGNTGMNDAIDTVAVSAGSTAKFILNNPGDMTVSTRLGYTVARQDAFGNTVASGSDTVFLYSSSTGSNAKFYNASTAGSVVSSVVITDGSSSADFWYFDDQDGTWTITVSNNATAPDGNAGINDDTDSVVVTTIPIIATKFVILQPSNGTVGDTIIVTVEAQDNFGSIDTTYQNDVTLSTSGSATGGGLVNIVNGVGTINISDTVAETVGVSLSDSQSTGLNVSSTKNVIFSAVNNTPIGGGGGVVITLPTTRNITFSGKAFSLAKIVVVLTTASQSIPVKQETISDNGLFSIGFNQLPTFTGVQGVYLSAFDSNNRTTFSKVYDLGESASMNFDNIFLSPTIGVLNPTVVKGKAVSVIGYAMPGYTVKLGINGKFTGQTVVADKNGYYQFSVNTASLDADSYLVKVRQVDNSGKESDDSLVTKFTVSLTALTEITADLNSDGIMNISDWSIFLYDWSSKDLSVRNRVDLNGDGKVDISDFSIFVKSL